jgi:hypothetical protein
MLNTRLILHDSLAVVNVHAINEVAELSVESIVDVTEQHDHETESRHVPDQARCSKAAGCNMR